MDKIILVKKPNMETLVIENVVQLNLCNMSALGDNVSDSGWNFISIITSKDGEKQKLIIKLEDIWQFSVIRNSNNKR